MSSGICANCGDSVNGYCFNCMGFVDEGEWSFYGDQSVADWERDQVIEREMANVALKKEINTKKKFNELYSRYLKICRGEAVQIDNSILEVDVFMIAHNQTSLVNGFAHDVVGNCTLLLFNKTINVRHELQELSSLIRERGWIPSIPLSIRIWKKDGSRRVKLKLTCIDQIIYHSIAYKISQQIAAQYSVHRHSNFDDSSFIVFSHHLQNDTTHKNVFKSKGKPRCLFFKNYYRGWSLFNESLSKIPNKDVFQIKIDVRSFFENIPHQGIYKALNNCNISDNLILPLKKLLEKWGAYGLPDDSSASYLLSEIYLLTFDDNLYELSKNPKIIKITRYLDDISILMHSDEIYQEVIDSIKLSLMNLNLSLNDSKTKLIKYSTGELLNSDFPTVEFARKLLHTVQIPICEMKSDIDNKLFSEFIRFSREKLILHSRNLSNFVEQGLDSFFKDLFEKDEESISFNDGFKRAIDKHGSLSELNDLIFMAISQIYINAFLMERIGDPYGVDIKRGRKKTSWGIISDTINRRYLSLDSNRNRALCNLVIEAKKSINENDQLDVIEQLFSNATCIYDKKTLHHIFIDILNKYKDASHQEGNTDGLFKFIIDAPLILNPEDFDSLLESLQQNRMGEVKDDFTSRVALNAIMFYPHTHNRAFKFNPLKILSPSEHKDFLKKYINRYESQTDLIILMCDNVLSFLLKGQYSDDFRKKIIDIYMEINQENILRIGQDAYRHFLRIPKVINFIMTQNDAKLELLENETSPFLL